MRFAILCITLHICVVYFSVAQAQKIIWQTTAGCSANDLVIDFLVESDGYVLVGNTGSDCPLLGINQGQSDGFIIKLDKAGNKIWSKQYGGTKGDGFTRIKPVSGGGYILIGNTLSADGDIFAARGSTDMWVVRIDASGTLVWSRTFGGSKIDYPHDVVETPDGSFIIVGFTTSNDGDISYLKGGPNDAWIIKIDGEGTLLWEKTYGSSQQDIAFSIVRTSADNYAVLSLASGADGDVPSVNGTGDAWVFNIDGAGNIGTSKTYGGLQAENPKLLLRTKDGGYLLAGTTNSADLPRGNKGMYDLWVVKTDDTGKVQWQKTYGGMFEEGMRAAMESKEGGYLVVAASKSNDGDAFGLCHGEGDIWVLKLDNTGRIEWTEMYGGSSGEGAAASVYQLADSTYMIAGTANSNNGDVQANYGAADGWIIRLGYAFPAGVENSAKGPKYKVYPTVTNDVVHISNPHQQDISFKLFNNLGQELRVSLQKQGNENLLYLGGYCPGLYFLQVQLNGITEVHKIIRE